MQCTLTSNQLCYHTYKPRKSGFIKNRREKSVTRAPVGPATPMLSLIPCRVLRARGSWGMRRCSGLQIVAHFTSSALPHYAITQPSLCAIALKRKKALKPPSQDRCSARTGGNCRQYYYYSLSTRAPCSRRFLCYVDSRRHGILSSSCKVVLFSMRRCVTTGLVSIRQGKAKQSIEGISS